MTVQTYTITIEHGDSITDIDTDDIMDSVVHDIDAALFDHTALHEPYTVALNGVVLFEFEGEPEQG